MLDFDLSILYKVETRVLKQSVRRNIDNFPVDFVFQLTEKTLGAIERGEANLNFGTLLDLAKLLNVTLAELINNLWQ